MSAVFEQVVDTCARGCFTGLLRVRTREGSGELRFLSGIQDGVRFGSMEGDAALERLQAASDPEFEVISSLPPIDGSSTEPVPIEGRLEDLHAAQLMRYCESNSLTCALELEVDGRVLTARYRLGELLSVEPDSEHTSRLAEAKKGSYRFRLPRFELPEHVAQRRAASARPAAAVQPKPASPPSPAVQARPVAAPAPKPAAAAPAPKPAVAPAPQPAAKPAAAAAKPATPPMAPAAPPMETAPAIAAAAAAPASARGPATPKAASAGAPLKASPAIAVTGGPTSSREVAPASTKAATPASSRDGSSREPAVAGAQAQPKAPSPVAPAPAPAPAHGQATPRAPLQDLWKDAVQPPSQAAPIELPARTRPGSDAAAAPARPAKADVRAGSSPELPPLPDDISPARGSSSKAWLWVALVMGAAAAAWAALGSPMP